MQLCFLRFSESCRRGRAIFSQKWYLRYHCDKDFFISYVKKAYVPIDLLFTNGLVNFSVDITVFDSSGSPKTVRASMRQTPSLIMGRVRKAVA